MILIDDKKAKYEKIYDTICDYLDNEFNKNNYCDFKNDKCIANREGKSKKDIMGCCYSFKEKWGFYFDHRLCKYLVNKNCEIRCMACKLFTCKYLKENGIFFDIDALPGIAIFNKKQKEILKNSFFKPREEIIEMLLEKAK